MRITNRVMNNNLLLNLNRGLTRLDRINNQLGSKKQINVPSDDPVKAGTILRTSTSIREVDQYRRNIDSAESWLDASDIVMKDVLAVIHRAKELGLRGASSHLDDTARQALADEVEQLHGNLLQLANSTHGGRYLFAGQYTQNKPFEEYPTGSGLPDVNFLVVVKGADGAPKLDENGDPLAPDPKAMSLDFEIGTGVMMGVN
ncbi:MAG TPA: flagellar hook-associated protein FlgL, partial [Limnochordia bacterium]|nr:flagellar hook-associated protein FlgL [Limnochordia bacterium]